jgi:hypothetical protein
LHDVSTWGWLETRIPLWLFLDKDRDLLWKQRSEKRVKVSSGNFQNIRVHKKVEIAMEGCRLSVARRTEKDTSFIPKTVIKRWLQEQENEQDLPSKRTAFHGN